jgi:hypothetical protein
MMGEGRAHGTAYSAAAGRDGGTEPRERAVRFRRQSTVLITSAAESRQTEIRRREVRYILSMSVRTLCFILAVVAFDGWVRLIAILVALILPWVAVVVANGGPPPASDRPSRFDRRARAEQPPPAELEPGRHVVVEGDVMADASVPTAGPSTGPTTSTGAGSLAK